MSEVSPIFSFDGYIDVNQVVNAGQLRKFIHSGKLDKKWQDAITRRTLLHLASASNQVDIINFLIGECRVNLNAQDRDGRTALHLAIIGGHLEATVAILKHKPDDCLCDSDHDPPLHVAIKQGVKSDKIMKELVKHSNVNLFVKGHHDCSCLHVAAEYNNLEALKLILAAMKQLHPEEVANWLQMKDKNGLTAFHHAAASGSSEVLAFLLSNCEGDKRLQVSNISGEERTPLHYAVERGQLKCVQVLLEYGADPTVMNDHQPSPLHSACIFDQLSIVKLMVDHCGTNILQLRNQRGGTTLHSSAFSVCSEGLISYLVENGVKMCVVDSSGFTALSTAIQYGSVNTVEEVMKHGGDPLIKDKWGYTALHRAVLSEKTETFKKIASSDTACVMAETPDSQGYHPIHHALKLGHHDMIVALLQITEEVFNDKDGNNYLHLAATFCEERTLSYLLGQPFAQCMLNQANYPGSTPLHCAAMHSKVGSVKNLLNYGAVILRDDNGLTPLMCACSRGHYGSVKLLYKGNDYQRDWMDHNGCNALHLAVAGNSADIVTFCLDAGMAIVLNKQQNSFLDDILAANSKKLAKAVASHKRWEECLDVCSPNQPHPILRILDQMPDVYRIILDHCHIKSDLNPAHPDYWEEFNFKCMDITLNDHRECSANKTTQMDGQQNAGKNRWWKESSNDENLFSVLQKLVSLHQESYMQHPVTSEFIRLKWMDFGFHFLAVALLLPFFVALSFSIFVTLIPLPPQNASVVSANSQNASMNATNELSTSISTGAEVLLYITLILSTLNLLHSTLQTFIEGFSLIPNFKKASLHIGTAFIASICIIVFLLSILIAGLDMALWNAAALGLLLAWFSVGFTHQYIHLANIGVHVTMLISTLWLIIFVTVSLFSFFLGFAFSFYVLLGSVADLQYETIGLSLFATLHSIIATTDFIGIVDVFQDGGLRFSPFVFVLLVVLIIMLPIVLINLLIGLAIGDINQNQKEATFIRQSIEVHTLSSIYQKAIPHHLAVRFSKKAHRRSPNKNMLATYTVNLFHVSQETSEASDANQCDGLQNSIEEKFAEHKELQYQLYYQLEKKLESITTDSSRNIKDIEAVFDAKIKKLERLLDKMN